MQKFAVKLPCYIGNYYVSMKSKESVNFFTRKKLADTEEGHTLRLHLGLGLNQGTSGLYVRPK